LLRFGIRPVVQYAIGRHRIDFVIPALDGRRVAIECDSDRYRGETAWTEEMRRQSVLERVGRCVFFRVRGTVFARDPDAALAGLWPLLAEMGLLPGFEPGSDGGRAPVFPAVSRPGSEPALAEPTMVLTTLDVDALVPGPPAETSAEYAYPAEDLLPAEPFASTPGLPAGPARPVGQAGAAEPMEAFAAVGPAYPAEEIAAAAHYSPTAQLPTIEPFSPEPAEQLPAPPEGLGPRFPQPISPAGPLPAPPALPTPPAAESPFPAEPPAEEPEEEWFGDHPTLPSASALGGFGDAQTIRSVDDLPDSDHPALQLPGLAKRNSGTVRQTPSGEESVSWWDGAPVEPFRGGEGVRASQAASDQTRALPVIPAPDAVPAGYHEAGWVSPDEARAVLLAYRSGVDTPVQTAGKIVGWACFYPDDSIEAQRFGANVEVVRQDEANTESAGWYTAREAAALVVAAEQRKDVAIVDPQHGDVGVAQFHPPESDPARTNESPTRLLRRA
jgi:hypothetical protein